MSLALRLLAVIVAIGCAAPSAHSQNVSMNGRYAVSDDAADVFRNAPENPPLATCDPVLARCIGRRRITPGDHVPTPPNQTPPCGPRCIALGLPAFSGTPNAIPLGRYGPSRGVGGARILPGTGGQALSPGGVFTIPPLVFRQARRPQTRQVLSNVINQIETSYAAAMPATHRSKHAGLISGAWTQTPLGGRGLKTFTNPAYVPPSTTRRFAPRSFSPANVAAHGQNNGLATTDPAYRYRQAIQTTRSSSFAADQLTLQYRNVKPMAFSGTAAVLLDGAGRFYFHNHFLSSAFDPMSNPNSLAPIVGSNRLGDEIPGFQIRNAAGWDYTVMDRQLPGVFKAFGPAVASIPTTMGVAHVPNTGIQGLPCSPDLGPIAPNPTCNLLDGDFDASGYSITPAASAVTTYHLFAWTTGTVSIAIDGPRNGVQVTQTFTGMGYDSVTPMGDRNLGLVAGSFALRSAVTGDLMKAQIAGLDLVFTPEPGSTIALAFGVALLGARGARQRSRARA